MLKLVKTIGGTHGTPPTCTGCKSTHFIKTGEAWNCSSCGLYYPKAFADLRKNIEKLQGLHGDLKNMIDCLERFVQTKPGIIKKERE
jgi:hypothetical protein